MPSVTQETPPPVLSAKKRRRDDANESITTTTTATNDRSSTTIPCPFSSPSLHSHSPSHLHDGTNTPHYHNVQALRKVMPLPAVKRIRTMDIKERGISTTPQQPKSNSPISQDHDRPTPVPTTTTTNLTPSTLMSRCHICSRKPTKKTDLDSFADCEGCRQRTCFICIRQCLDWRPRSFRDEMTGCDRQKGRVSLGAMSTDSFTMQDASEAPDVSENHDHDQSVARPEENASKHQQPNDPEGWPAKGEHRQTVCSKCCVETGKDGDVVCLGCLPFVG